MLDEQGAEVGATVITICPGRLLHSKVANGCMTEGAQSSLGISTRVSTEHAPSSECYT